MNATEAKKALEEVTLFLESLPSCHSQKVASLKARDLQTWMRFAIKGDNPDAKSERTGENVD